MQDPTSDEDGFQLMMATPADVDRRAAREAQRAWADA